MSKMLEISKLAYSKTCNKFDLNRHLMLLCVMYLLILTPLCQALAVLSVAAVCCFESSQGPRG